MSKNLKNIVIWFIFISLYGISIFTTLTRNEKIYILFNNILFIWIVFVLLGGGLIIYIIMKKSQSMIIFIKIIVFILILSIYFFIEHSLLKLFLYGIGGDNGGIGIDHKSISGYEVLFWNFVFSLHYPIYIFIFFKPFVNHLDKSIRKIKEDKSK